MGTHPWANRSAGTAWAFWASVRLAKLWYGVQVHYNNHKRLRPEIEDALEAPIGKT